MGLDGDIGVGSFPIDACGYVAIVIAGEEDVKEGDGVILFVFSSKLNPT